MKTDWKEIEHFVEFSGSNLNARKMEIELAKAVLELKSKLIQ